MAPDEQETLAKCDTWLTEEGRPGDQSDILQDPLIFHKVQSCVSNTTCESCGCDRGAEFLKDWGVYRIKTQGKESTKWGGEKCNEPWPSSYDGGGIV